MRWPVCDRCSGLAEEAWNAERAAEVAAKELAAKQAEETARQEAVEAVEAERVAAKKEVRLHDPFSMLHWRVTNVHWSHMCDSVSVLPSCKVDIGLRHDLA